MDYPLNPASSSDLESFDAPVGDDSHNDFGGRIHGYLHPDTSGDYTFWIAADDHTRLSLSTDDDPANAVEIAGHDSYTSHNQWEKFDSQKSAPVSLVGGQRYYIMAIYRDGTGGDNCSVAWQGPDSPTRRVIDGYFLSPFLRVLAINPDPADGATGVLKTAVLSWVAGETAVSNNVYLSTDQQAVIDGTVAPVNV
ncbi:MAG: PA14 domain-containing protein, partial [Planctomycetota bacterium]